MGYGSRGNGRDVERVGLTGPWRSGEGTETRLYSANATQCSEVSMRTIDETWA